MAGMVGSSRLAAILLLLAILRPVNSGHEHWRIYTNEIERDPLVVLHGVGGASMEMMLHNAEPESEWCRRNFNTWHTAWVLPRHMIPRRTTCLVEYLTPVYEPWDENYGSRPGVEIRVKDFGSMSGLVNVGPQDIQIWLFDYMKVLARQLTRRLGYEIGKDLYGAPYDWRFTPDALDSMGYFINLKALVETAYATGGCRKVHLLGHSLGALTALAFLNRMTPDWKAKYIASYIPVGGPFGGSLMNVLGSVSGYNMGSPLEPGRLRDFEASCPSGTYLLPDQALYPPTEVLVQTPSKNYSAWDYDQLFTDLGLDQTKKALPYIRAQALSPPEVDTHAIYSEMMPTVVKLQYNKDFQPGVMPEDPIRIYGDGDGTVPERSLERPFNEWPHGPWALTKNVLHNVDHMNIINTVDFYEALAPIIARGPGMVRMKQFMDWEAAMGLENGFRAYQRPR